MKLDFGGVAKGYTADQLSLLLSHHDVHSYLIDAGGDIKLGAPPPDSSGWKVAHGYREAIFDASHISIAGSGTTYRSLEIGDTVYSHIVDPRTGVGLVNQPIVYVHARHAVIADVIASLVSVAGGDIVPEKIRHEEDVKIFMKVSIEND